MPRFAYIFVAAALFAGCQTPDTQTEPKNPETPAATEDAGESEPQVVERLVSAPEKFTFYAEWPEGWHPKARVGAPEKTRFIEVSGKRSTPSTAEDTLVTAVVYCAEGTPDCESMRAFVDEARQEHSWLRVVHISDQLARRIIHVNGIAVVGHRPLTFHRLIRAQAIEAAALHAQTRLVADDLYRAISEKNMKAYEKLVAEQIRLRDACLSEQKTPACLEILRGYFGRNDWLAPLIDEAGLRVAAKNACENGEPTGCTVHEEFQSEGPLEVDRYQEQCEQSSGYACWRAARATLKKVPEDEWSATAKKACEDGFGCRLYALAVLRVDDTEAGSGPLLEKACNAGDATSCAVAAMYQRDDAARLVMLALAKLDGPEEIRTISLAALTADLGEKEREWLKVHEAYAPLMPGR